MGFNVRYGLPNYVYNFKAKHETCFSCVKYFLRKILSSSFKAENI